MSVRIVQSMDGAFLTFAMQLYYEKIAEAAANDTISKLIGDAVIEELDKSPDFKEAIRKLAVEKILKIINAQEKI